jgi:hypothetical protein
MLSVSEDLFGTRQTLGYTDFAVRSTFMAAGRMNGMTGELWTQEEKGSVGG